MKATIKDLISIWDLLPKNPKAVDIALATYAYFNKVDIDEAKQKTMAELKDFADKHRSLLYFDTPKEKPFTELRTIDGKETWRVDTEIVGWTADKWLDYSTLCEGQSVIKAVAPTLAFICVKEIGEKYDSSKLNEKLEAVKRIPAIDGYRSASHFIQQSQISNDITLAFSRLLTMEAEQTTTAN